MGLGAPKRRSKLSHDPNNTAWAKSTSNFGHRILSSQGWKPGDYLGAANASHADHYTAANASHIRVLLREESLGLGAKIGGNKAETFGLSLFSGVLGRLNGKSTQDLEKQAGALRDAELRQFQATKYGMMNFVSGGLLIGDKIERAGSSQKHEMENKNNSKSAGQTVRAGEKRKAESDLGHQVQTKSRRRRTEQSEVSSDNAVDSRSSLEDHEPGSDKVEDDGNETRPRAPIDIRTDEHEETTLEKRNKAPRRDTDQVGVPPLVARPSKEERRRMKEEKRARKEERRKRKDGKRQRTTASEDAAPFAFEAAKFDNKDHEGSETVQRPVSTMQIGRHAVRHRYIQQKRMVSMDPQAMKEIFMLKAAG